MKANTPADDDQTMNFNDRRQITGREGKLEKGSCGKMILIKI